MHLILEKGHYIAKFIEFELSIHVSTATENLFQNIYVTQPIQVCTILSTAQYHYSFNEPKITLRWYCLKLVISVNAFLCEVTSPLTAEAPLNTKSIASQNLHMQSRREKPFEFTESYKRCYIYKVSLIIFKQQVPYNANSSYYKCCEEV